MIALAFFLLAGCGPTCQNTCTQIWRGCNLEDPNGRDQGELIRECEQECSRAMRISGDIGDYNPERVRVAAEATTLETDTQAAAWMDCVWAHIPEATSEQCEDLNPRQPYCAPI